MKDNAKKELTAPAKTPQSSRSRNDPQLVQPPEILDMEVLSGRLDKTTANIRKEIGNVTKSFCRIGFELWMAKENKLYLGQGFGSVYEYSEKLLGFQKTSTAGYIAVCEKFSIIKNGKPTAQLDSEYSNFSYSQLSLMLSLPSKKLGEITPDKTCKEIREIKKSVKNTDVIAVAQTSLFNNAIE